MIVINVMVYFAVLRKKVWSSNEVTRIPSIFSSNDIIYGHRGVCSCNCAEDTHADRPNHRDFHHRWSVHILRDHGRHESRPNDRSDSGTFRGNGCCCRLLTDFRLFSFPVDSHVRGCDLRGRGCRRRCGFRRHMGRRGEGRSSRVLQLQRGSNNASHVVHQHHRRWFDLFVAVRCKSGASSTISQREVSILPHNSLKYTFFV